MMRGTRRPERPAASVLGMNEAEPLVLSRREGAITHLTLNRPRAINALNREMFQLLLDAVAKAQTDGSSAILIDGAGERGTCGGGDIKELSAGDARSILALEYELDYRIATSWIPVVGIMDGVTMGGGIGLTGHADLRIVTETARLAMPEVRIGIAPDVGGHLLLANAPGRLGELLAVTAGEMNAFDAIALGFADLYVPSDRLGALAEALAAGEDPGEACARFAKDPQDSVLLTARAWWDPIAEAALGTLDAEAEPAGAAQSLVSALEASADARAAQTAETVRGMCPASVAVTLAQIERTRRRGLDLAEVLSDDLRVLGRLGARPDFAEGVRAQVIDKDRNPKWQPARIEDLDPTELEGILAPLDPDEASLPI